MPATQPNFDRIARAYRWLELFTFGHALQRCRTALLSSLTLSSRALVIGDGDGRALEALLREQPHLLVTAVDLSPAMLVQLRSRCRRHAAQITIRAGNALGVTRGFEPEVRFDLVTTHFVLDCFAPRDLVVLIETITAHTEAGAQWIVSEFRIPRQGWRRSVARILVRLLYAAFGALTGLQVRTLPDHAQVFSNAGWLRLHTVRRVGGLLTAELWQRVPPEIIAL